MRSVFLSAAVLGLIFGSTPALAQTSGEPAADEPAAAEGAKGAESTTPDYSIDTPLAKIDGSELTLGELIAIRRELPDQYQALPNEVLMNGILEQMVDQYLLAEAARETGLGDRPAVELNVLNQQRAILAEAFLRAETEKRVTAESVKNLYEERYVKAEPETEAHAGHILVETKEKAEELKAKIDEGADFAELAKEHGTDGTASRGGDLGWFVRSDMVPEFGDAVFSMEPGTISEPVETPFGWHLIKLEELRDRKPPAFEEVQGELRAEAVQQAQRAIVEELRAEADIEMPEAPVPPEAIRADDMLDAAE